MAVLGSTAGCVSLYWLGRWKGYGYLRRKYSESKLESILGIFQRYGVFALIIPAMWPPPLPFKIFVLSAGIFGLSFPRFLGAVLLGRSARYFFEAAMAVRYGDQALEYLRQNYMIVVYLVIALVVVGFGTYLGVTQFRRRQLQPR